MVVGPLTRCLEDPEAQSCDTTGVQSERSPHCVTARRHRITRWVASVFFATASVGYTVAQPAAPASGEAVATELPAITPAMKLAGEKIVQKGTAGGAAACASCHGAQGEGGAAFPRLAGTGQAYLLEQLGAYASGGRKNAIMQGVAAALTEPEREAVTAYFSSLPPLMAKNPEPAAKPADNGAWLATRGRWSDDIPACAQCHGPGGSGVGAHFPPLAGLPEAYIAQQLKDWKTGARPPGPLALMPAVAGRLKDADIDAVAKYYAGLSVAASTPQSAEGSGATVRKEAAQ